MKKLLGKFSIINATVLVGIIILIGAAYSWWHWVYSSPKHVFDRMIVTSLSSNSVTRTIKQDDGVQILDQTSQLTLAPNKRVHATNTLRQVADAGTVVDTESIATPTTDFVRYLGIKTSQKNSKGNNFDFASVVGLWGKADNQDELSGGAQLFTQNLLGVMPVANLPAQARKDLVKLITSNQVFKTDYKSVKRANEDGRPVYSYDVTIEPKAYVSMLKLFARDVGLTQLEHVDPAQYEGSDPLKFTFDVDVWSGQLRNITYKDSQRSEHMAAYGAQLLINPPASAVTLDELQSKLQAIQ